MKSADYKNVIIFIIKRRPDAGGSSETDSDLRLDFLNCVYDSLLTMVTYVSVFNNIKNKLL